MCWTQAVRYIDPCFVTTRRQYRGELGALKLLYSHTLFEIVKIGRQLLSYNIALEARLGKAEIRERNHQAVREAVEAKLAKVCSDSDVFVELQKRHAACDVSVQG